MLTLRHNMSTLFYGHQSFDAHCNLYLFFCHILTRMVLLLVEINTYASLPGGGYKFGPNKNLQ